MVIFLQWIHVKVGFKNKFYWKVLHIYFQKQCNIFRRNKKKIFISGWYFFNVEVNRLQILHLLSIISLSAHNTQSMMCWKRPKSYFSSYNNPAMHAVMKQATFPAIIARTTTCARAVCRRGAIAPKAPSMTPMELKLENPHKA